MIKYEFALDADDTFGPVEIIKSAFLSSEAEAQEWAKVLTEKHKTIVVYRKVVVPYGKD